MDLVFDRVTKFYGPVIGVNDVECRFEPGIVGLLGANGAGKSTLLKLAAGQLRPSYGEVRVGAFAARSTDAHRHVGYCPASGAFYEDMTCREFVRAMAVLYGHTRREAQERAEIALEEVGMTERAERRMGGCSHGMRQRVNLAQALVNDPAVLLLDEPLTGIDPGGRREMNELLRRLAESGKTIIVSTHLLHEIEALVDEIMMMSQGRLIATGTLAEIRAMIDDEPMTIAIEAREARKLAARLVELPEVQSIEIDGDVVRVRSHRVAKFYAAFGQLASDESWQVRRLEALDAGADSVFRYLEQGAT
ncbi:MAG TPA: ABC transporter ATP-binding protein [Pirellulales bacterium]|nr:ABC transporter ATP-binding protein [Pirellulales bacterium]